MRGPDLAAGTPPEFMAARLRQLAEQYETSAAAHLAAGLDEWADAMNAQAGHYRGRLAAWERWRRNE